MSSTTRIFQRLVRADRSDQSPQDQAATARNGLRQITAEALQSTGDQVVNAKTVLPWALAAVGAPAALTALLVPVRESGSMLPQAAMAPVLQRSRRRAHYWLVGAAGQALSTAGMACAVAFTSGWVAGLLIVVALAIFALSRSLNSLAGKDVLGRTVPKGERGQISGLTATASGAVAITFGLAIRAFGGDDASPLVLAGLLLAAAVAWVLALAAFAGIREPEVDSEDLVSRTDDQPSWVSQSWQLLRDDQPFRQFVLARGLLLVSALSPPFVVAMAAQAGGHSLAGLGPFVIAQGLAGLIGGRIAGRLADRSSQKLMVWAAALASLVVLAYLLLERIPDVRDAGWLHPAVFLVLALAHVGVRVARKTYVVDMAGDDRRTTYVAVSNTLMGVLLLIVGGLSSALALLGADVALAFLAVLGLIGAWISHRLPEVSKSVTV
ncbi:MFS transporter [Ornithinimicrobium sp. Y1847]|uniref:MFS transporter n=1 Tax=Ornithinimicrobium sp. Y1847 TaxID=3405419 RepID=UPI003B67D2A5